MTAATDLPAEVEVLIIGGGPVGLAAAGFLGAAGVTTLLVERRSRTIAHPKASGIHSRTLEIFRRWGVAPAVRAAGIPPEQARGIGWLTRLDGVELGRIMLGPESGNRPAGPPPSPEPPCFCPQNEVEPILLAFARRAPSVTVRFSSEALGLDQDELGVTASIGGSGSVATVRAQYVIAADGIAGATRTSLGLTETGVAPFGHSLDVHFEAELRPYLRDKPFVMSWIVNATTQGTIGAGSADLTRWTYNFAADPAQVYSDDQLVAQVRAAVGAPRLEVRILGALSWDYDQAVADAWRVGRVFLAGDAAHRFPPHAGFGMNSGVQDVENLAWKLISVLRHGAGDGLLDTYETERSPVATVNGQQALANTRAMADTGWHVADPDELEPIEHPVAGREIRSRISAAIPAQEEHFHFDGQQFGVVYRSPAVVPDGSAAPGSSVSVYRESAHPGARAPHVALVRADGTPGSTVDLWGTFVLLTDADPDGWRAAATSWRSTSGLDVPVHPIGPGAGLRAVDGDWKAAYGLGPGGAVLVRPDGYVGARFAELPVDPASVLEAALRTILQIA